MKYLITVGLLLVVSSLGWRATADTVQERAAADQAAAVKLLPAFQDGYKQGYRDAYQDAYRTAYREGHHDGYSLGYTEGSSKH